MGEIRGEKVVFRKQDIVPLHELPSAQAHEPIVLHAVETGRMGLFCRFAAATVALVLFIGAVVVGLVETGMFDSTLNARAVAALNQALGPRYRASVDHTVLRLAGLSGFALRAQDARIIDVESGKELATTDAVGIVLSGKENGAVRYLGYAIFAAETLYLASETIGSIIGTSGFFLISGLVVALIAWAVITLERRLSRSETKAEA